MPQQLLSKDDVSRLLETPSDDVRIDTAEKVCVAYSSQTLNADQRAIAEEVFRLLVMDQSKAVRESISENLKFSEALPHDVAVKLARDVDDSVALPMLQCSQVLNDDDLIEIVQTMASDRMAVIAGRPHVSEGVVDELLERGDENVAVRLIRNEGADIGETSFENAYARFSGSENFDGAVVARDRIPVSVRSKVLAALTDSFMEVLSGSVDVSPSIISDIVIQSHDKLVMQMSDKTTESQIGELVTSLHERALLTQPILIRALCQGDILFFEIGMATLAGIPIANCRSLIYDAGGEGFKALYQHSGFDASYLPFFQLAFKMCRELVASGEDYEQTVFRRKLIERLLTEGTEVVDQLDKGDLEYLLGKI